MKRLASLLVSAVAATGFAVAVAPPLHAQAAAPAVRQVRDGALGALDTLPTSPTHARIQTRSYDFTQAGIPMTYELYVPSSYDRARSTPLIVALHCLGAVASEMIRYEGLTELAEARGYIVVAPMGYNSRGWYGSRGPGRASERGEAADDPPNLGELSEADVMNVLALVRAELNIDPQRMYLMGHSMGGGGTYHIGIKHPSLWAGLGVAAPAIYGSPDTLEAITHIPVIVVMGDEDALVNVNVTRQWVEKMKALGMTHRYIEVAGGDHMRVITHNRQNMTAIFDFFDRASQR